MINFIERARKSVLLPMVVILLSVLSIAGVTDLVVDGNGICSRAVNFINQIKISHALYLNQSAVYNYEDNAVIELVGTVAGTGNLINGSDAKTTPVDADNVAITNSADSHKLGKTTWANIKATLKTYFDTLYQAVLTKAGSADIIAGIDDAKYATAKALYDAGIRANVQQIYTYAQDATITEAMKGGLLTNSGADTNVTYTFAPNLSDGFWVDVVNEVGGGISAYTKLMLNLNNNVTDISENTHTATATDITYSTADGKFSYYGIFNGSTSKIEVPTSADFNLADENWAFSAWLKFTAVTGNQCIFETAWATEGQQGILVYFDGSAKNITIAYTTDGGTDKSTSPAWNPSADTWYKLTIIRDGTSLKTYVNDAQIGSTYNISTDSIYFNSFGFTVGNSAMSSFAFNGKMDEVRLDKGTTFSISNFYPQSTEYYNGSTITLAPASGEQLPGTAAADNTLTSSTKGDVKNFFNTGNSWISKYTNGTWTDGL